MPVSSRAKWSQLRVGLMACVALGILGVIVFLLAGTNTFFKSTSDIYTYFDDSAATAVASPVTLNGITVGKVTKVVLSGSNQPGKIIRVTMQVEDQYLTAIPVDSHAEITAGNLLGAKYINIKKGRSQQTMVKEGVVPSIDVATIDDVVKQGNTTLTALQSIVVKVGAIVDDIQSGKGTIGKILEDETLYNKAMGIVDGFQKATDSINAIISDDKNSVGKLLHDNGEIYNQLHTTVTKVNGLIDDFDKGDGSVGKLMKDPALFNDLHKTLESFNQILTDINAGKGSVGKILKSDELSDQIKGTIARLDVMLDKINKGDGTVGQLLNNPALYENIDGTTREVRALLKDFRANPKKFLTIQLKIF
jgi:phospholipid/cholesterol/gamma-HCH transport system substrate-binding protein